MFLLQNGIQGILCCINNSKNKFKFTLTLICPELFFLCFFLIFIGITISIPKMNKMHFLSLRHFRFSREHPCHIWHAGQIYEHFSPIQFIDIFIHKYQAISRLYCLDMHESYFLLVDKFFVYFFL